MIYYIRFGSDCGYDDITGIGRQKWSMWFNNGGAYNIGYCHIHPSDNFQSGKYYFFEGQEYGKEIK